MLLAFVLSGALAGVRRRAARGPQRQRPARSWARWSTPCRRWPRPTSGATAIKPGRFNVLGTMVAIFFLAFTVTGLSLAGVANWINDVFNGAALFVAVLISTIIGRKRAGLG